MVTIVGGVYREICVVPHSDCVFGSAGRSAAALCDVVTDIKLCTYIPHTLQRAINLLERENGLIIQGPEVSQSITFKYFTPLSEPAVFPNYPNITKNEPVSVSDNVILRFGMLDGNAVVNGERVIYDPQSGAKPEPFNENGSTAKHLAVVLNHSEGKAITKLNYPLRIAKTILANWKCEVVVLKMGARGSLVVDKSHNKKNVPAYRSKSVWKIGSGDIFSATFSYYWGVKKFNAMKSAELASKATCYYCETRALPIISKSQNSKYTYSAISPRKGKVYLAAPFFDISERWILEEVRNIFYGMGIEVFSPLHEVGFGSDKFVAKNDLDGLNNCSVIFAILNGIDPGTIFEIGYGVAKGIPVIVFSENMSKEDLKLITGTGCKVYRDLTTAIYHTAWESK